MNEIDNLQEALRHSPENVPLRKFLANTLLKHNRAAEAELEFKTILKQVPTDDDAKLGLAKAFHVQKKDALALVVLEELIPGSQHGPSYLLFAKVLLATNQAQEAKSAYDQAIRLDVDLSDAFLESSINQKIQTPDEPEKIKLSAGPDLPEGIENTVDIERPSIDFKSVGGMQKIKEEISLKIIHPLENPEIYKAYGKKIGGGILMYGPPGCGKTHLARATAGQVKANFIPVGISDILNMYIGQSERNLHQIFQQARDMKPCVLFFDEVDALGANRTDMRQSAGRHLINQFLSELDGVEYSNEGVLVLAATNAPWHLDPAFRRPGRFDRIIFVPPPDQEARAEIFNIHLKDKPVGALKLEKLSRKSEKYSGADIQALIDIAIESKLEASLKAGRPLPIEQQDIEKALKRHKPSTAEWFTTAKNYAMFANESGLYNEILDYLNIKRR
ncbi:MAG: AAA family ATPase [Bacteroidota bacterium]